MTTPTPYYADDMVTLYHGDCREITAWLEADVLVTDPPYGRGWKQGWTRTARGERDHDDRPGIAGDESTATRDAALSAWGNRLAIVFGDPLLAPPPGAKQVLGYVKASDGGNKGTFAGFRRDLEVIYLMGPWVAGLNGRSGVLKSGTSLQAGAHGIATRYGHPHAKPVDVMETLIAACPLGVIADPFAGAGSTLVAARNLGRRAIGVEIDERYCEAAARRLQQNVLIMGAVS
jgi:site-specific DNA-methyltransferase (adenine-specific)